MVDKDKVFNQAIKSLKGVLEGSEKAGLLLEELKSLYQHLDKPKSSSHQRSKISYALPNLKTGQDIEYYAFSDGACRGNPGPGAWGVVVQASDGTLIYERASVVKSTTNNRMELMGAIKALEFVIDRGGKSICLGSDSKYVLDGLESWMAGWKKRGWKKADKKEPENLDLWKQLDQLKSEFDLFHGLWIKGHAGHPQNERCDQLANEALDEAGY